MDRCSRRSRSWRVECKRELAVISESAGSAVDILVISECGCVYEREK